MIIATLSGAGGRAPRLRSRSSASVRVSSATAAIVLVVLMVWIVRQASPVADGAFGDEQIFEPQQTE